MEGFASSLEHLLAELEQVDLFLRLQVHRSRQLHQADERFAGLYISEQEVDEICAEPAGLPRWASAPLTVSEENVWRALDEAALRITARKALSLERGVELRLERLISLFRLEQFEVHALLICLAPEIDLRYERLFAYLQDDVQRRRPTVDLVLNLLCPTFTAKLAARECFAPSSSLVKHRLIELHDDPARPNAALLGKQVDIDRRIAGFLLGSDEVDSVIARHTFALATDSGLSFGDQPRRYAHAIAERSRGGPVLVHIRGAPGVGKRAWAAATAAALNTPLLCLDCDALLADKDAPFTALAHSAVREATLRGASLYFSGVDALLCDEQQAQRSALLTEIARCGVLAFLAGAAAWDGIARVDGIALLRVELALPTCDEREHLWRRALAEPLTPQLAAELPVIAGRFRLTHEDIRAAAAEAHDRAALRQAAVGPADLYRACRERSARRLGGLAQKVEAHCRWSDLVLPADPLRQLREICEQVRLRARVFEKWGFEHKLSRGKGLHALFSGPSGTGKTMAAEVMAVELELELFKIDLSSVLSKYIGETEKNLERIFTAAEATGAVLFFDEADALFGKRSEVKDAHDRHANVETSYLLQRMEAHDGICILATNLRRNMDEAFSRRLAFAVQFPFPEPLERERLWRGAFPPDTPLAPDVDFEFMANQFKLSGGGIKNVVLAAAFLAASDGGPVAMEHLVRATRRELQKLGRTHANSEFGVYSSMLSDEAHPDYASRGPD